MPRTADPAPPLAIRSGIAIAALSATIALVYATIRVIQLIFYPETDPALVVWSARAAMFWRFWIGLYIGGIVAIGAFGWASRSPERATLWLNRLILLSAIAITLQGIFLP